MLSFGKSLGGGFRLRTSNPLIVIPLGSMMLMWWCGLACLWLCWQMLYWPSLWSVRGARAIVRAARRRQLATG